MCYLCTVAETQRQEAGKARQACSRKPHTALSYSLFTLKSMIRITLYQNNNSASQAYQKWYPRVVTEETIGLDELAEHMSNHNTPYSKGAIKGILTDAVSCTKELLLLGKNVKYPDLAIFSIGLKVKAGADSKEDFSVVRNIAGLKLRARATGELMTANLDTTIKRADAVKGDTASADTTV